MFKTFNVDQANSHLAWESDFVEPGSGLALDSLSLAGLASVEPGPAVFELSPESFKPGLASFEPGLRPYRSVAWHPLGLAQDPL